MDDYLGLNGVINSTQSTDNQYFKHLFIKQYITPISFNEGDNWVY